jgi:hypothetical protein
MRDNTGETEADYNRLAEYYEAQDEMRYRRRVLETEATDENYDELWAAYDSANTLLAEIRATITDWHA